MRRIVVIGAAVIAILGAAAFFLMRSPGVQNAVMEQAIQTRMGAAPLEIPSDRLDILFCGTGSPMPDPNRSGSCVAILVDGKVYLFDAGPGADRRLNEYRVRLDRLAGVFLSHFHSDHIGGLGEVRLFSWIAGREQLPVYGPPGVNEVVEGFNRVYMLDGLYRTAHHGEELLPQSTEDLVPVVVPRPGPEGRVVLEEGQLKVTAFRVDHSPIEPAYGYRVDYGDRSFVFSGDTVKHPNLVTFGRGADVMIHEVLAPHMVSALANGMRAAGQPGRAKLLDDTLNYHTSPVEAAETANEAGVPWLLYWHIVPPLMNDVMESIFLQGVDDVRPEGVRLSHDGMLVQLPLGSDEVIFTEAP